MNKVIRCIAPLVLVLFFCGLFAGPGWGEEIAADNTKVDYKIYYYSVDLFGNKWQEIVNPKTGSDFYISIYANYDHKSVEELNIGKFDGFEVKESKNNGWPIMFGAMGTTWEHVYKLKAPDKEGVYKCVFEGTQEGNPYFFSVDVKVTDKQVLASEAQEQQISDSALGIFIGIGGLALLIALPALLSHSR
jgi:hypothetical protein